MLTKSEAAFRFTVQKLFATVPKVYFWTFTVKKSYPDWCYPQIWSRFFREMQNIFGDTLMGVRVVERHKTHGLHWHCLLNRRVWVGEVRRVGARYGIGRDHVAVATLDVGEYLAKYLSKQWEEETLSYSKGSRWSTIGSFRGCRVRDVELESRTMDRVKQVRAYLGERKIPFILAKWIFENPFATDFECRLRVHQLVPGFQPRHGSWGDYDGQDAHLAALTSAGKCR